MPQPPLACLSFPKHTKFSRPAKFHNAPMRNLFYFENAPASITLSRNRKREISIPHDKNENYNFILVFHVFFFVLRLTVLPVVFFVTVFFDLDFVLHLQDSFLFCALFLRLAILNYEHWHEIINKTSHIGTNFSIDTKK